MKVGDLVKTTFDSKYGVIFKMTATSFFVHWIGIFHGNYVAGYNYHNYDRYLILLGGD